MASPVAPEAIPAVEVDGAVREIRVLIVDADPRTAQTSRQALQGRGFAIDAVADPEAAAPALATKTYHLALIEITPPDRRGFALLVEMRRTAPTTIPIAISSDSTVRNAVEAVKLGAYDYLVKPFTPESLGEAISDALEKRAFFGGARTGPMDEFHGMVGRSRAMLELRQWVNKTAGSHASVLLTGELGTGKELVAKVLHERSSRSVGPFVVARCSGAGTAALLAEWCGTMRGGAVSPGAFELASGGTLYLRDVGDMSAELQAALVSILVERRFTPVGGTDPHKLNVRLISATDRNLATLVTDGRFRQDLFYRIAGHTVRCPALRERREDIPLLVDYFLTRFCRQSRHKPIQVTPAAYALLVDHSWPGNVRELECVIEEAALRSQRDALDVDDFRFVEGDPIASPVPISAGELKRRLKALRAEAVVELERLFVVRALERHQGNVSRAAREVGMQRPNFQALMRRHRVRSGDYTNPVGGRSGAGEVEGEVATEDGDEGEKGEEG